MNPELINFILLLILSAFFFYWLRRLSQWVRALSKTIIEMGDAVEALQTTEATKSYLNAKIALQHLRAIEKPTAEDFDKINKAEQYMAEFEKKYKVDVKDL